MRAGSKHGTLAERQLRSVGDDLDWTEQLVSPGGCRGPVGRRLESFFVLADERDVVRLRTNYRSENVYLYRLDVPPEGARLLLGAYLDVINGLRERPEWYNALTHNCTTTIQGLTRSHINDRARAAGDDPRFSVRIRDGLARMSLASGPRRGDKVNSALQRRRRPR